MFRLSVSLQRKCYACRLLSKNSSSWISVNEEIREALFSEKPIIALESTIITHGMSFPHNFETCTAVEKIIREQSAIPATIAVLKGQIKIGLTEEELLELSQCQKKCVKISRRDFPYVISHKLSGGTTVAGTMVVAHKIGIPIFVTGGIGGVHRKGETTMDISADLTELGRTPIAVFSSGVKSILDIEKTLEYLETQGVAVATYGLSKEFPAFYCKKSGFNSPFNVESDSQAAQFVQAMLDIQLNSGVLIAVPIPNNYSFNENLIESAIDKALEKAKENKIIGKDITPFLLNEISKITEGKSLESNKALIKNNALIGGRVAVELSKLRKNREKRLSKSVFDFKCKTESVSVEVNKKNNFEVVVIGGINLDLVVNVEEENFKPKAVFFSCIDSRMIPTRFTETCVGDMFVVRNAGNVVPHSKYYPDEITTNEPAALELGCVLNNVRHIIVCGHSDCKAMNLLYSLRNEEYASLTSRRISPLRAWMCAHASSSLEKFLKLQKEDLKQPLVFSAETPLNKFVAYIDIEDKFKVEDKLSQMIGQTVPGKITHSGGGVARNMADALGKLQVNTLLISAVGEETFGKFVLQETIPHLDWKGITKLKDEKTGTCVVLCDRKGECLLVIGDMNIHKTLSPKDLLKHLDEIAASSLVVLDGNLQETTLKFLLNFCQENSVPIWYEPTDIYKASKPFLAKSNNFPEFISPNFQEFLKIYEALKPQNSIYTKEHLTPLEMCIAKGYEMAELINNIIITLGKEGVLIIRKGNATDPFFHNLRSPVYLKPTGLISHRFYKQNLVHDSFIVNVSGAGDCFASGFIASMLQGKDEESCVQFGFQCSAKSLKTLFTVPQNFF